MTEQRRDENMIAGLLRERAALATTGNADRVAQVDEQLKHYGYDGDPEKDARAQLDGTTAPQGRDAGGGQQTAEGKGQGDGAEPKPATKAATGKAPGK